MNKILKEPSGRDKRNEQNNIGKWKFSGKEMVTPGWWSFMVISGNLWLGAGVASMHGYRGQNSTCGICLTSRPFWLFWGRISYRPGARLSRIGRRSSESQGVVCPSYQSDGITVCATKTGFLLHSWSSSNWGTYSASTLLLGFISQPKCN